MLRWLVVLIILWCPALGIAQDWKAQLLTSLGDGGVYVEDAAGHPLLSHRIDESFVPASTIKVATAACALHLLGAEFRFPTDFFLLADGGLGVKGYGDPVLLSEEFPRIARALHQKGITSINGILLDTSFFSPDIAIDGVERSANPYDALNGAMVANFNTIHVRKLRNGTVESAEPQTPVTPLTIELAKRLPAGTHRINLAGNSERALRYVAELLVAFLEQEGIAVTGGFRHGTLPADVRLGYRHFSSQPLREVLRGLLEFSTNFTANQIFLAMGAQQFGAPATVEKGVKALAQFLRDRVGWRNPQVAEGSGLSRLTRVTPRQMMQLLRYFEPHRALLPVKDQVFSAKTGTLLGANTYVGYFPLQNGTHARFVILVNDQVPFEHKFKIARLLYTGLNGTPPPRNGHIH